MISTFDFQVWGQYFAKSWNVTNVLWWGLPTKLCQVMHNIFCWLFLRRLIQQCSYKFRLKLFLVKSFKKKLNRSLFIRFYGISDVKAIEDFTVSYDLMKNEIHVTLPPISLKHEKHFLLLTCVDNNSPSVGLEHYFTLSRKPLRF